MSISLGTLSNSDLNNTYVIQQNNQNSLKGLLWITTANALTVTSLTLTVGTVGLAALTALALIAGNDSPVSFGNMALVSVATGAANYMAVKFTGFCFSNAIHHFGPEFQIVKSK